MQRSNKNSSRLTPPEALAMAHAAGAWLEAAGDDLLLHGVDAPPEALAAALEQHRAALLRYVSAFPDDRWPGWGR